MAKWKTMLKNIEFNIFFIQMVKYASKRAISDLAKQYKHP